jgi:hypothetical protein
MSRVNSGLLLTALAVILYFGINAVQANPDGWRYEWPRTDFSKHSVKFDEIMSGGPPKDGIPSIDKPKFEPVSSHKELGENEPVIGLIINGKARAYPLRVLIWHEIVNDTFEGVPIAVTYCPLCNSSIVFDRRLDGKVLEFGTTGKLRKSDMVMYDRQTDSWWQQFLGKGIVGVMTGKQLKTIPARLESFANFKKRAPMGAKVLVPNFGVFRAYGQNPYAYYDSSAMPFLYQGEMPKGIKPMVRVIAVGNSAWSMPLLVKKGRIEAGDLVLSWEKGQNSALDSREIAKGRDVGNVVVRRKVGNKLEDVTYDVTFAFVFHAFKPKGTLHIN